MITKEIALSLHSGQTLHHKTVKMADGKTPMRVRVNGKCKTWKTRPDDFKLPVKHGLRDCGYIDNFDFRNAADWELVP